MAKLVPNIQIHVTRKGERVVAEPGVAFDFTDAEIAEVRSIDPDHFREPINESASVKSFGTKVSDDKSSEAAL